MIVPTYRSGDGLDRVVRSLDEQTLAADEFEVLFIDDESGDDTPQRLHEIARTRPNFAVHEISRSGWPSRPRNTGVQLARGEYVLFMDHDDELYPEALSAAYDFAAAAQLDILNAKEVTWTADNWSWVEYNADIAPQQPKDPGLLIPMMPHKLYRTEFLRSCGIRFREGQRVHWEDRLFNVAAYAQAKRIGMLSSVPFYKWHTETGSNNSQSYVGNPRQWDLDIYWPVMIDVFDEFARVLAPADLLKMQQIEYVARVLLTWVGPRSLNLSRELVERSRERMRPFVAKHAPLEVDAGLSPVALARSYLLRDDQDALLWRLAEADQRVWARTTPVEASWASDGRLHLSCTTTWRLSGDGDLKFRRVGDRLLRDLEPSLLQALPPELVDVTDHIEQAESVLALRESTDMAPFPLPQTTSRVRIGGDEDLATVSVAADVALDLADAIMGRPIKDGSWQFACRSEVLGYFHRKALVSEAKPVVRLVNGVVTWVGPGDDGVLTLVKGQDVPDFLDTARARTVAATDVTTVRAGVRHQRVTVGLRSVKATGTTSIPCALVLTDLTGQQRRHDARLLGDSDGVRIEATVGLAPGRYAIGISYAGRTVHTKVSFDVDRLRRVSVVTPAE